MTLLPAALLFFSLLCAGPGLYLLTRAGWRPALGGSLCLLLATACAYGGWHSLHATAPAATDFVGTARRGHFQTISPAQLPAALAASRGRPLLLEFHADWCPSCLRWQQQVFARPEVQAALGDTVLLRLDATRLDPAIQALLDQHQLPGLPALLVYDRQGREQAALRRLGEMSAADFLHWWQYSALPQL